MRIILCAAAVLLLPSCASSIKSYQDAVVGSTHVIKRKAKEDAPSRGENLDQISVTIRELAKVDSASMADQAAPIPSEQKWRAERDEFLKLYSSYRDESTRLHKKIKRSSNLFLASGIVIGTAGTTVGAVIANPLVLGISGGATTALTGLGAGLKLNENKQKAADCAKYLHESLAEFTANWPDSQYPTTKSRYNEFVKSKQAIMKKAKAMDCYGLFDED